MQKRDRPGRPKEPGKVYRFDFYYRLIPGADPPELKDLLEAIIANKGRKRRDILRAALLGGAQQAQETALSVEDSQDSSDFDELFDDF